MKILSTLACLALPFLVPALASAQNASFDPPTAPDLDPAPDVVEVQLVAEETDWEYTPGVTTRVWSYNGQVPGPTIRANVGDLLRVQFENRLPEPTTIHWHGIEGPADMDGSHIAQAWIQPGETFTYEFRLLRDGLYWYHPHIRTFDQVEKGLHGVLLVRDPELERRLGFDRIEEHIVVFDDILLDANGQVVPAFSFTDPLQRVLYALNGREGNVLLVNGKAAGTRSLTVRNGELMRWRVVNVANTSFCRLDLSADTHMPMIQIGTDSGLIDRPIPRPPVIPFITPPQTRPGGPGSAGPRAASIPLPDRLGIDEFEGPQYHTVPQVDRQGILLVPGERMDVLFLPRADDGDTLRVFQHDWFRGRHTAEFAPDGSIILSDDTQDGRMPPRFYLNLNVVGPRPKAIPKVPTELRTIEHIDPADAVGTLAVTLGHTLPTPQGDVTMFAQARFEPMAGGGTKMVPLPTALVDSFEAHDVDLGETWIWEITNLSHGDHPFHTHGFFFQPYEVEFVDQDVAIFNKTVSLPITFPKDTIRVPARPGLRGRSKTILRALVRFDDTGREGRAFAEGSTATFDRDGRWTSGGWLFHCHVLEHAALGMLSFFEVHDPSSPFRLLGKSLPGTLGKASLTGYRAPVPGLAFELDLVGAPPNTPVTLGLGRNADRTSRFGGTVVPRLEHFVRAVTDDRGHATFRVRGWEALGSGVTLYAQAAFFDTGAPRGVGLSNSLSVELP
ncbi:MAG TPA: multicopper oxidase family protein [Planctomycetes bacterium]|nr:multicopper oxidase family protein [Planctomycetota bacterium]